MWLSNLYAKARLLPLHNKRIEIWTSENLLVMLVGGGMHFKDLVIDLHHKHRLAMAFREVLSDKQILLLATQFGHKFKRYPFGNRLFYREIDITETKKNQKGR